MPPLERLDRSEVLRLIEQKRYFVLHAPRQTGKTSALIALRDKLNSTGRYRAAYVNVEPAQVVRDDVQAGMRAILTALSIEGEDNLNDSFIGGIWLGVLESVGAYMALREVLRQWSAADPRPLILMIDEIDALSGDMLISVLRQLRSGYPERPDNFPQSMILCGVRDVRDYRIRSGRDNQIITGGRQCFQHQGKVPAIGGFR